MRILNREQFLAMPPNTLFCEYYGHPEFGQLCVKLDSYGENAFVYVVLDSVSSDDSDNFGNLLAEKSNGETFSMDFDCTSRDAIYEPDRCFAVFEPQDVKQLIARLTLCVDSAHVPVDTSRE